MTAGSLAALSRSYTSEFCTLDTVALKVFIALAQRRASARPGKRRLAPLTRRLTPVLTSSYTTHRQTQHVEKLAATLDASLLLLQGFHQFGLELMRRYAIHHAVGPEWSAGFLRLRLFRFPAVCEGGGYCSSGQEET